MASDRSVARAAVAFGAAVLAAAVAVTTGSSTSADRRAAARDLLVLARRGDTISYRADYRVTRRIAGGRDLTVAVTDFVRARPPLVVAESGGQVTITTDRAEWVCTPVEDRHQCLRTSDPAPLRPAIAPFAIALASGRYDVERARGRVIAGLPAQCFVLRRSARARPIVGLGDRLDACLAANGLLLSSRVVQGRVADSRTAVRVYRGLSAEDLAAVARRDTDGSVSALPSR